MERCATLGAAWRIHSRSCPNQGADNVAAAGPAAFVRDAVQRSAARGPYVGVGAKAKQQLDEPQVPVRRCVVKKGSAVSVMNTSQRWIGQQFAFGIFEEWVTAASHRQPEYMCEHRAIARESSFERGTLHQLKCAACITAANGGYQIIERTLLYPSFCNFDANAIV